MKSTFAIYEAGKLMKRIRKPKLTRDQVRKLTKAVKLARRPGLCQYLDRARRPICPIGQLAMLEGIPTKEILRWGNYMVDDLFVPGSCGEGDLLSNAEAIKAYPKRLLKSLQTTWDNAKGKGTTTHTKSGRKRLTEDQARAKMLELVKKAAA